MKGCFLSGGSPACLPNKSRVVEAICILLCNKFPNARKASRSQGVAYPSRWKLVVSDNNNIRSRLYNSQALLEGTNLMLYSINEAVLIRWYKNVSRREEISMLMQGLVLPTPRPCSSSSLLPAMEQRSSPPPPPVEPFEFHEPADTYGLAHVCGVPSISANMMISPVSTISSTIAVITTTSAPLHHYPPPSLSTSIVAIPTNNVVTVSGATGTSSTLPPEAATTTILSAAEVTVTTTPKTTQWRHEKGLLTKAPRKSYLCKECGRSKSKQTGHSQYNSCLIKRRYYCPYKGIPKEEWLSAIKREEQQLASGAAAKAATATPDFSGSDTE